MSAQVDISYAAVEAFERSKEPDRRVSATLLFTGVLLAVFFVVLMGGLAAGVAMYRSTAAAQMETDALRTEIGLMTSYVRANDQAGALGVGSGPEGRALVLTEGGDTGTYEVRIYLYRGQLLQEYSVAGAEYTPARAQVLVGTDTFDFQLSGKLLSVTTDQGTIHLALRSGS